MKTLPLLLLLFSLSFASSAKADEPSHGTPPSTPFRSAQHEIDEMLNYGAYSLYVEKQFKEIDDILRHFIANKEKNAIDAFSAQLFYDKLIAICYVIEKRIPFDELDEGAKKNAKLLLQLRLFLMNALELKPNTDAKPSAQDIAAKFPLFLEAVKIDLPNLSSEK